MRFPLRDSSGWSLGWLAVLCACLNVDQSAGVPSLSTLPNTQEALLTGDFTDFQYDSPFVPKPNAANRFLYAQISGGNALVCKEVVNPSNVMNALVYPSNQNLSSTATTCEAVQASIALSAAFVAVGQSNGGLKAYYQDFTRGISTELSLVNEFSTGPVAWMLSSDGNKLWLLSNGRPNGNLRLGSVDQGGFGSRNDWGTTPLQPHAAAMDGVGVIYVAGVATAGPTPRYRVIARNLDGTSLWESGLLSNTSSTLPATPRLATSAKQWNDYPRMLLVLTPDEKLLYALHWNSTTSYALYAVTPATGLVQWAQRVLLSMPPGTPGSNALKFTVNGMTLDFKRQVLYLTGSYVSGSGSNLKCFLLLVDPLTRAVTSQTTWSDTDGSDDCQGVLLDDNSNQSGIRLYGSTSSSRMGTQNTGLNPSSSSVSYFEGHFALNRFATVANSVGAITLGNPYTLNLGAFFDAQGLPLYDFTSAVPTVMLTVLARNSSRMYTYMGLNVSWSSQLATNLGSNDLTFTIAVPPASDALGEYGTITITASTFVRTVSYVGIGFRPTRAQSFIYEPAATMPIGTQETVIVLAADQTPSSSSSGVSLSVIIIVAVAGALGLLVVGTVAFFCTLGRSRRRKQPARDPPLTASGNLGRPQYMQVNPYKMNAMMSAVPSSSMSSLMTAPPQPSSQGYPPQIHAPWSQGYPPQSQGFLVYSSNTSLDQAGLNGGSNFGGRMTNFGGGLPLAASAQSLRGTVPTSAASHASSASQARLNMDANLKKPEAPEQPALGHSSSLASAPYQPAVAAAQGVPIPSITSMSMTVAGDPNILCLPGHLKVPWTRTVLKSLMVRKDVIEIWSAKITGEPHALSTPPQDVVIKKVVDTDATTQDRFSHEIAVTALVTGHASVVRLLGWCESPLAMIMMQYPRSLDHLLVNKKTRITLQNTIVPVAQGLQYIHGLLVAHQDMKLSNIFVDFAPDGSIRPVIGDFGISLMLDTFNSVHAQKHIRQFGFSAAYAAPEILNGTMAKFLATGQAVETSKYEWVQSQDVYSLGVIAWECMHRKRVWEGRESPEIKDAVLAGARPPWSLAALNISPTDAALIELINSVWVDNVEARPTSEAFCNSVSALPETSWSL